MGRQPKFIVFEGIDGSGTTTQAELLHKAINHYSHLTKEPTNGEMGQLARKIIAETPKDRELPSSLAYIFASDRHEHLYNPHHGVVYWLKYGSTVVCDRYSMSSFAYDNGPDEDLLLQLNERFLVPDLTIFLDVPVETALKRIASRGKVIDYHETEASLQKVSSRYRNLVYGAKQDNPYYSFFGQIVWIKGDRPIDEVHADILKKVSKLWEDDNS